MRSYSEVYDVVIIGGGPAGTGLLLKAMKDGPESPLWGNRIALIEKTSSLVSGNLTKYKVNSDTLSEVFLECLEGRTGEFIDLEQLEQEIEFINSFKGSSIPLFLLERYFEKLGSLMKSELESKGLCKFMMNTVVDQIVVSGNDKFSIFLQNSLTVIQAKRVVIATGGKSVTQVHRPYFNNTVSLSTYTDKLIDSDSVLKHGLSERLVASIVKNPKITIMGGSHSAFSVAHYLLNNYNIIPFKQHSISIWSSSVPKIFFQSKSHALDHNYYDFSDDDFCPVTQKLYRLAGLRMDGRKLYMEILGLKNMLKESRVLFQKHHQNNHELINDLNNSSIIITAWGYHFNIFPILKPTGDEYTFSGNLTGHWVNDHCELIESNGNVVPNLFACGLATGFIPSGYLGGEPSFSGQTNGIWYYQNAIANLIINRLSCEHSTNLS